MIPRVSKANGLARSAVIEAIAVVGVAIVVVGIAVERNVRVPRLVRRLDSVRLETNTALPRARLLREVIPVSVLAARVVRIAPVTIVVHEKIGREVSVARNGMIVPATNLDWSRPPANQLRPPHPRPAVSMISVPEFLKSNLRRLRLPPTRPTRFPLVALVRNPLHKVHEQRILFCVAEVDQRIGRLRMSSFGPTKIRTCNRHPSAALSRHRVFRRPTKRASLMKWSRPLMSYRWTKTMTHCVRVAVVAAVVSLVRSRVPRHRMATREPRLI